MKTIYEIKTKEKSFVLGLFGLLFGVGWLVFVRFFHVFFSVFPFLVVVFEGWW